MMNPKPTAAIVRTAIGLAAMFALLFALASTSSAGPRLGDVRGTVEVSADGDAWRPGEPGAELAPASLVRTGDDGRAEVQLDSGTVRVFENSVLRLPNDASTADTSLELREGRSLFDVLRREGSRFEVETPEVIVSVKGTRFEVDLRDVMAHVSVFHGVVGVRDLDADRVVETLVREGFSAFGGRDLPFEVELAPDLDPWSGWERGAVPEVRRELRIERAAEVDEVRAAALRASNRDVLIHAARRNPDVARRLGEMVKQRQPADAAQDAIGGGETKAALDGDRHRDLVKAQMARHREMQRGEEASGASERAEMSSEALEQRIENHSDLREALVRREMKELQNPTPAPPASPAPGSPGPSVTGNHDLVETLGTANIAKLAGEEFKWSTLQPALDMVADMMESMDLEDMAERDRDAMEAMLEAQMLQSLDITQEQAAKLSTMIGEKLAAP